MSEQITERPPTADPGNGVLPGIAAEEPSGSRRNRTFLIVALAIVAGLVLGGAMLYLMQREAVEEVDAAAAAAGAAAWSEAEARAEAEAAEIAAAGEAAATRTKVKITSRDPFAPLVPKEPSAKAAPAPASQPAADGSSAVASSTTGATISALTISADGDSVKLKLDGEKYSVDEGEAFAKSYRLYDIFNDSCAGFLYGDQNAVVCEGDSVTIG